MVAGIAGPRDRQPTQRGNTEPANTATFNVSCDNTHFPALNVVLDVIACSSYASTPVTPVRYILRCFVSSSGIWIYDILSLVCSFSFYLSILILTLHLLSRCIDIASGFSFRSLSRNIFAGFISLRRATSSAGEIDSRPDIR